jgi:hypothetical protein
VDSRPPALALKAVKGADERTPLLAVVRRTQSESIGAGGSVPREPEAVDIHTERSIPADIRPSASSSVATTSMPGLHKESHHQPHLNDLGYEEEEEEEVGAPEMDSPSLPPPLPPTETPSHLTQLQRPPSDDGDRPAWFASQLECAICLSQFEVGDRVRLLPCGHVFHLQEVDEWLIRQRKVVCVTVFSEVMHCQPATAKQCPVCKMDVTLPRIHSPPPTSRMPSFALPDLTSPSSWRTALSRRLDDWREWVRVSPAQQRADIGV